MAITRRQFVTRLGTIAAAMGMSQVDLAKVTEALAHGGAWAGGTFTNKPKVIWVHGAECTGCSTSLLSFFEDVRGTAIEGSGTSTLAALDLAVGGDGDGGNIVGGLTEAATGITKETSDVSHPYGHRTLFESETGAAFDVTKNDAFAANIADVLIDFIDLQYHETVMGMGGDLAYQWLNDNITNGSGSDFVLVVEGAVQDKALNGFWNAAGAAAWCSIGMGAESGELSFDHVVQSLAEDDKCAAVLAVGQCAAFGGYPACVSPTLGGGQTGATGVHRFLTAKSSAAADKVINVPGCPVNPWWVVLSVVAWLVDATAITAGGDSKLGILGDGLAINTSAVDAQRRLKIVFGKPMHGKMCARYQDFVNGKFAAKPGDPGCLQLIGCKGPSTNTLCGYHGWNGQQPTNSRSYDYGISGMTKNTALTPAVVGGNCVAAGHPCMGCTEDGYPDRFVPFVNR